jgi:hypothetical protein
MSDDKTKRHGQDRTRISMDEDYEVRYWTEELGVSKERLQEAVDTVGNSAEKVREYLSSSTQVGK